MARCLDAAYPDADCTLRFETPFHLLVATILSAQCTDERVNRLTPSLFRKYPQPEDFLRAPQEELEADIRPTGFFRSKSRAIQATCRYLLENHDGEVPSTMLELLPLPGVARKTANVVLGSAFGVSEGIAVDTHVRRVAGRLGLTRQTDPEKIEADLMRLYPRERWTNLSHQMILHGRNICEARKPRCPACPLLHVCRFGKRVFPQAVTPPAG